MTENLKMTVLIDNIAEEPFVCEWGLSILVEADEKKILLDSGSSELFAENAQVLGFDLDEVDTAVLSHAHYDHSDGMEKFFQSNSHAPFLLRKGTLENCYGIREGELYYIGICRGIVEKYADRVKYVSGVYEIADGIWLVPHRNADYSKIAVRNDLFIMKDGKKHPDDFVHEQSLVIETEKGLVIFNSCSHTGMLNILADVKEMLGREDVYAYVGGLHLFRLTDEELTDLCAEIKSTQVDQIYTGHCTGDHAFEFLRDALGEQRIHQLSSGYKADLS